MSDRPKTEGRKPFSTLTFPFHLVSGIKIGHRPAEDPPPSPNPDTQRPSPDTVPGSKARRPTPGFHSLCVFYSPPFFLALEPRADKAWCFRDRLSIQPTFLRDQTRSRERGFNVEQTDLNGWLVCVFCACGQHGPGTSQATGSSCTECCTAPKTIIFESTTRRYILALETKPVI